MKAKEVKKRKRLERTTPQERAALKNAVTRKIKELQDSQESNISELKVNYPNVKKVIAKDYNVRNLFIEMGILRLYEFYVNATSNRTPFHVKNEMYYILVKMFKL